MSLSRQKLFSFITGAAIGVVAGILLAPDSGRQTRRRLKRKTDELKEISLENFKKGVKYTGEAV